VLDEQCDPEALVPLPKVVAQGTDSGLGYSVLLTQDYVRGGPLINAFPYYFTVRSYVVNTSLVPRVKESADTVRTVVPQTPPGGTLLTDRGGMLTVTRGQVGAGVPTTDSVVVTVIDPALLIDASYRIGYKPDPDTGLPVWYLVRTTASGTDTLLNNMTNFSPDPSIPIVDGIQVGIIGAPYRQLLDVSYVNAGPNPPAYGGFAGDNNLGLDFFDGSADYWAHISNLLGGFAPLIRPDSIEAFNNFEIRFTGGSPGQKAYHYVATNSSPRYYLYQDFVDVPFTAWDVDNNRQLNVGFNEMAAAAPNGVWDPDSTEDADPFARREFVVVFASTYSATPLPFYTTQYDTLNVNSNHLDGIYLFWPRRLDESGVTIPVDPGDKVVYQLASRSANDFFTFSTTAPERGNVGAARSELARSKAVPNPYFAHSAYELNQFNRVVKFTHLPERCTIRIFNLAGDPIRTLEKSDGTSLATWDLQTDRGLPVGSGVYIFHIDAPGVGTHVGKVAVFMEKERLNVY
jgi:hypothetical protein